MSFVLAPQDPVWIKAHPTAYTDRLKETLSFLKLSQKSKRPPLTVGALLKMKLPAPIMQTNPVAVGQLVPAAVCELRLLLSLTCSISEKDVQSKALLSTTKGDRFPYSQQSRAAISCYIATLSIPVATAALNQTLPASLLPRQHLFRCQGTLKLRA